MFKDLLRLDTLRGEHGTGVMAVGVDQKPHTLKKAVLPGELFDMGRYDKTVTWEAQVLMGHNRWATKGKVNHANCHPFEHGDVIGAHNGTLVNQSLLPDSKDFAVDSDNLIYAIDKDGVENTIARTDGAFALSLYNHVTHTLMLCRNSERSLYFCWDKEMEVVFWASEEWMLYVAADRNKITLSDKTVDLHPYSLYTFDLPNLKSKAIDPPRVRKLEEYVRPKAPPPVSSNGGKGNSGNGKSRGNNTKGGLNAYTGERVHFYAVDTVPKGKGRTEVHGITVDNPNYEVRINVDDDIAYEMLNWEGEIVGQVCGNMSGYFNNLTKEHTPPYLKIDPKVCEYVQDVLTCDGPGDKQITEEEFNKLTKHGCSYCTQNLEFLVDECHWMDNHPFCEHCYDIYGNVILIGDNKC
jgi:hypothetical protein